MSSTSKALTLSAAIAALAFAGAQAAPDQSAPNHDTSSATDQVQEVTVTAQRARLANRVRTFVAHIAAPENEEGLPLWTTQRPVCPLVSGLPRQDGEFILERLSEIARAAEVPLAGEHCRPNLYILVSTKPEELLRGMEKRNRGFTFGYDLSYSPPVPTPESAVDNFIEMPRAVRVWYNTVEIDAWGKPLGFGAFRGMPVRVVHAYGPEYSRLKSLTVWEFGRVFVIADQRRMQGVAIGQLADYVSMAGLAKLKPDAQLGDTPTVLRLFDGAPRAAPAGMTDWDRAFLKSLYGTEQTLKQQQRQVANTMVRQLEH